MHSGDPIGGERNDDRQSGGGYQLDEDWDWPGGPLTSPEPGGPERVAPIAPISVLRILRSVPGIPGLFFVAPIVLELANARISGR